MQNLTLGFEITLTDGTNTDDLGEVVDINTGNNTITVETATTNSFLAATPTYVQFTVVFVDMEIGATGYMNVAAHKIGSAPLPKNTPLVCKYTNKSPTDTKRFVAYIEALY